MIRPLPLLVAVVSLVLASACSGGHRSRARAGAEGNAVQAGERVSVKGSDTMVVLAQQLAERYMQTRPGTALEVSGGGSGTGIAALLNRTTDIANASRPLNARERGQMPAAVETRVALDALAVYVHHTNRLPSVTMAQLALVFRGRITNWSELGGEDRPIVLYSRENNSGTYAYFKEHVLGGNDFAAAAQTLPGTAAVIHAVAHDRNGIGYGGIGFGTGVRTVPVATEDGAPVAPTLENATGGLYPLSRFLFMVTREPATGATRAFLDWVVSPEGQAVVTPAGFYPLP